MKDLSNEPLLPGWHECPNCTESNDAVRARCEMCKGEGVVAEKQWLQWGRVYASQVRYHSGRNTVFVPEEKS